MCGYMHALSLSTRTIFSINCKGKNNNNVICVEIISNKNLGCNDNVGVSSNNINLQFASSFTTFSWSQAKKMEQKQWAADKTNLALIRDPEHTNL
jgi:hypothetical protein